MLFVRAEEWPLRGRYGRAEPLRGGEGAHGATGQGRASDRTGVEAHRYSREGRWPGVR